jgi:hypothetical protein
LIRSNVARRTAAFRDITVVNLLSGADYYSRVADVLGVDSKALRILNVGFRDCVAQLCADP